MIEKPLKITRISAFSFPIRWKKNTSSVNCHDIRTGTLDARITNPSVREVVAKNLTPDCVRTPSMSQYITTLYFYSNGLRYVCTMYASSECYFGVNLNPLCDPSEVSYTLIPSMAYFEFLPINRSSNGVTVTEKEQQELVDLVDVKLGEEVVTTYAGLYRYKVGDVLRVAGFKNVSWSRAIRRTESQN